LQQLFQKTNVPAELFVVGISSYHDSEYNGANVIEKKNKKPSTIYLDLGFESLSHFSHSFKKKFGKAPSEWL